MKGILSFLSVLVIPISLYSQVPGTKILGPLTVMDTIKLSEGDTLNLGLGTSPTKNFMFVFDDQMFGAPNSFANRFVIIKGFKQDNRTKLGKKYYATFSTGALFNWGLDLEGAIRAGEVIGVNYKYFNAPKKAAGVTTQKPSVADELKKLKELFDQGVLTKEEFDLQKKKILSQ